MSDREPEEWGGSECSPAVYWVLTRAADWRPALPTDIPGDVFDRLTGAVNGDQSGEVWREYPTRFAAIADLSLTGPAVAPEPAVAPAVSDPRPPGATP